MYVLLALLALGLLLAVHELGHLLAARLLGVSVPRFSLGFGPPLLSFHLLGTEYVVAAIPLGASATLHGMNPHAPGLDPADPRSYSAQRPWKRVVITLAGSLANYLFALGVLFALYTSGTHVVVPLTVGTVTPGSEAALAQLLPGDRILSVDGQPVKSWSDFVESIGQSPGRERSLVVSRHGEPRVVAVRPRPDERGVGRIGVSQQYVYREHSPGEALAQSLVHTQRVAAEALTLVWSRVVGPSPTAEPPSSVAVVRQSSGAASTGWDSFLRVLVAISVALSLLHLVPVPGLDGGRLVFLAIELARRRPVSPRVETLANTVGFLAIAAAILIISVAEVRRALPSSEPRAAPGPGAPAGPALLDGGEASSQPPLPDAGVQAPDAGAQTPDAGGTSRAGLVSDAGRPTPAPVPDAGVASDAGPAPDGGLPPLDAGAPTGPGSAPDAGGPLLDAGAADAG
ncbi:M50 family metallopeptidase [Hyalangium gracile]|uniref:M50 family metallopeptidase n=1 Tax=Hyalangium gracile TaxID=394092 RepID=UPI001CC9E021|nr:M50 family metallopeptidase [Hyalangium gracile]